jgi:hypothetical protein
VQVVRQPDHHDVDLVVGTSAPMSVYWRGMSRMRPNSSARSALRL